jgi:molecular chaperone HtpG
VKDQTEYKISTEALSPSTPLVSVTEDEFMRRMREMSRTGGQAMFGNLPTEYKLVVNSNHKKGKAILEAKGKAQSKVIQKAINLALLSAGLLIGEKLHAFLQEEQKNL